LAILLLPAIYMAVCNGLLNSLAASIMGGLLFLFMAVISGGGVGGGDIKLVTVLGLALGLPDLIITLLATFILGGVYCLLIKLSRHQSGPVNLPLAPFIMMGVIMTISDAIAKLI